MTLLATAPASAQSSNLYDGRNSVSIDYVDTITADHSPTVQLSFGSSTTIRNFTMDTGSVGIAVSHLYFTPEPGAKKLGSGMQYYSSDNKTESGTWWEATQNIYSNGELVAQAKVPVLQVEWEKNCRPEETCHIDYSPTTTMMGVGFAREGAVDQPDPHRHSPAYNAFLNLTAVQLTPGGPLVALPADWHKGYVVGADQIELGLTTDNTTNAGFIKLAPNAEYYTPTNKEWMAVPAAITADGNVYTDGTVLMDTGLKVGLLNPSGAVSTFKCDKDGHSDPSGDYNCAHHNTAMAVSLPSEGFPIFYYDFRMNDSDPLRPPEIHVGDLSEASFNTGLRVFRGVNLIFDADNGFVGYQLAMSGPDAPTVNTWMALGGSFTIPDNFSSSLPLMLFAASTLSPEGSATFSGVISGAQTLTIDGPGRVILSAANTYTGATKVVSGRLAVNGSIVSAVTVDQGGELGGTGRIDADVRVQSGGVYAPGNSIGRQIITGNLSFGAGGIYAVELDPTTSDVAEVSGSIDLTGAILQLIFTRDTYAPVMAYEIIDNTGGTPAVGTFAQVLSPFVFFLPSIDYDFGPDHDVQLTLVRSTDFSAVAQTPNELAVAEAVEKLPASSRLFQAIQFQPTAASAREAFNALSGEVHSTVPSVLANDSHFVRDILFGRLVQAYYGGNGGGPAASGLAAGGPTAAAGLDGVPLMGLGMGPEADAAERRDEVSPITFWTQGYGAWASFDGNANAAGANRTLGGVLSGMDAMFAEGWRGGVALGFAQSSVGVGARRSSASVDSYQLAAYGSGEVGAFVVRGGAVWAWNGIDTTRAIEFPGFSDSAAASYDGNTGQVFGALALPVVQAQMTYEPFAGLAWVGVDTDGFVETGGDAALVGTATRDDVGYMTLGLRAATTTFVDGVQVTPRAAVAWQHPFGDVTPNQGLAFAAFGQSFIASGIPLTANSALLDAGVDVLLAPEATLSVFYAGQLAGDVEDHGLSGRVNWRF